MNCLCNIFHRLERTEKALALFEVLLKANSDELGEDQKNTLTAMGNFARCLQNVNRRQRALDLREKALECRKIVPGEGFPEIILLMIAISHLARSYDDLGQEQMARDLREVFHMRKNVLVKSIQLLLQASLLSQSPITISDGSKRLWIWGERGVREK